MWYNIMWNIEKNSNSLVKWINGVLTKFDNGSSLKEVLTGLILKAEITLKLDLKYRSKKPHTQAKTICQYWRENLISFK